MYSSDDNARTTPDSGNPDNDDDEDDDDDDGDEEEDKDREVLLELPRTAQEMRDRITRRKKTDPRADNKIDLWQKHSIVQAL